MRALVYHGPRQLSWVSTAPGELSGLVDGRFDMHEAPAAFGELARGESDASKVLVYPHGVPPATTSRKDHA